MTKLERNALARCPLNKSYVEFLYESHERINETTLKALLESHERLRMELEGAQVLIEESQEGK